MSIVAKVLQKLETFFQKYIQTIKKKEREKSNKVWSLLIQMSDQSYRSYVKEKML